jgi:hypothetical protein
MGFNSGLKVLTDFKNNFKLNYTHMYIAIVKMVTRSRSTI